MEARIYRAALVVAALLSLGASYRTENFIVKAQTPEIAQQIALAAEEFRNELAIQWLGKPMPRWSQPCPIEVYVAPGLGAGGETSFVFDRGEVFGWDMKVQGSLERVLDSVLPHEVTHTIFATYFRRPLPRWADEGACTTVEHESERRKQQQNLVTFLKTNRGIAFSDMFRMKEYPPDVHPLYAQGYSVTSFLIDQGGRKKFLDFVQEGLETDRWVEACQRHYGFNTLAQLQDTWLNWVRIGSPLPVPPELAPVKRASQEALASNIGGAPAGAGSDGTLKAPDEGTIYRGQSPDPISRSSVTSAPLVDIASLRPARRSQPSALDVRGSLNATFADNADEAKWAADVIGRHLPSPTAGVNAVGRDVEGRNDRGIDAGAAVAAETARVPGRSVYEVRLSPSALQKR